MDSKYRSRLASFVILESAGKILLARRFNTGYADGMYQMPSGHVEKGEYPIEAAMREAKEEVGVDIKREDLKISHVSYRITNDDTGSYVDFFFKATKWSGDPINNEPDKCDDLIWVDPNQLPENTVEVIKKALGYISKGIPFSEIGRK